MPSQKGKRKNSKKGGKKAKTPTKVAKPVEQKQEEDTEVAEGAAVAMDTAPDAVVAEKKVSLQEFDDAEDAQNAGDKTKAIALYHACLAVEDKNQVYGKIKEQAVYNMTKLYAEKGEKEVLRTLLVEIRPFLNTMAKAKTAKIVRQVVEIVGRNIGDDIDLQVEICLDAIAWCKTEKRTFLKQRLQTRLADLLMRKGEFKESINIINRVVKEVKKFDDKLLLVEINLLESRVYHKLQNMPKAKAALTSSRSAANAVYCPPLLQAQIDLQAGTLCAEEQDFKTAFSYFYEAFEGYNTVQYINEATSSLKYMLLCKIMCNQAEDVYSIVNGKAGVKYAGRDVSAMREVADAYKQRSVHAFQKVFKAYAAELGQDGIIAAHLEQLEANLLEQNLNRLIEPYSRVQIAHVAKLIDLPVKQVQAKLSGMILDKKFAGILDQGSGDLIVFEPHETDKTFTAAADTIKELSGVVDKLYKKASTLDV